jgi:chromosome segregation ATPase
MENQNTAQSMDSLKRLNGVVEELILVVQNQKAKYQQELEARNNRISGLQTEIQNLNNALNNRKAQIEDLDNKNKLLSAQLGEAQIKLENSLGNNEETARLQALLDEKTAQSSAWEEKYNQAQENLKQNQANFDETAQQIDGVIARLEKVLQENGASNNNN